jgi:hypothetical protein
MDTNSNNKTTTTNKSSLDNEDFILVLDKIITLGHLNSEIFTERVNMIAANLLTNEKKHEVD